jgi:hypothetical protein
MGTKRPFVGAVLVVSLAGALAACQTTAIYKTPGEAFVQDVAVTKTARQGSDAMAAGLRIAVLSKASGFPRSGNPKCVRIDIDYFHIKNPAMSLLFGDSNKMQGTMTVIDAKSGATDATVRLVTFDTYLLNGVIGAAQAATQDPAVVERRLVDSLGQRAVEHLYGNEAARKQAKPPLSAVAPAAAEPTAAEASAGTCR